MYKIAIQYLKTEEFQEIGEYHTYENALDRFQKMLVFFKIPHFLDYTPGDEKEYQYTHPEQQTTLKLTRHED
jgi:hypothetical protein